MVRVASLVRPEAHGCMGGRNATELHSGCTSTAHDIMCVRKRPCCSSQSAACARARVRVRVWAFGEFPGKWMQAEVGHGGRWPGQCSTAALKRWNMRTEARACLEWPPPGIPGPRTHGTSPHPRPHRGPRNARCLASWGWGGGLAQYPLTRQQHRDPLMRLASPRRACCCCLFSKHMERNGAAQRAYILGSSPLIAGCSALVVTLLFPATSVRAVAPYTNTPHRYQNVLIEGYHKSLNFDDESIMKAAVSIILALLAVFGAEAHRNEIIEDLPGLTDEMKKVRWGWMGPRIFRVAQRVGC